MFIAMNRFRIAPGREAEFIEVWRQRDSRLNEVPGFLSFNLLQGPGDAQATLFVSHSTWDSSAAFEAWTRSDAFRAAHAGAGQQRGLYLGPPQFEGFEQMIPRARTSLVLELKHGKRLVQHDAARLDGTPKHREQVTLQISRTHEYVEV